MPRAHVEERLRAWEQQDDEPNEQYEKFLTFLGIPRAERSVAEAWFRHTRTDRGTTEDGRRVRPGGQWFEDAHTWRWRERALSWDREQDRIVFAKLADRRVKSALAIAELGETLRGKATAAARALAPVAQLEGEHNGQRVIILKAELTPEQIVKMAEVGVKLEQLAIGAPTEHTKLSGDVDNPVGITVENAKEMIKRRLEEIRKRREEAAAGEDDEEGGEE